MTDLKTTTPEAELDRLHTGMEFERNSLLKKPEAMVPLTPDLYEFVAREMYMCRHDPVYFANKYYTIVSPGKGKHIISTYEKQDELIRTLVHKNRVVTLAARQTGKTTSYCIFSCWMVCFNFDKKILILANKLEIAKDIIARVKLAFELLPKWLKPGVVEWNKTAVEFSNGCRIEVAATSPDAARGKSANILILDEAAFIPINIMNELWTSVYPIISSAKNTKCIMVSTPNGTGNLFYDTYRSAQLGVEHGGETWTPIRIDWWDVPDRDEEWKQQQLASFGGDLTKFRQEFGNEFLGSTYTLVDVRRLAETAKRIMEANLQSEELRIRDYTLQQWERPRLDRCYSVGVDVADGTGNDFTVITVLDVTEPTKEIKQVLSYSDNKVSTPEAAYILAKVGNMYNRAPMMIEANNMGETVIDFLHLVYEYENIASIGHNKLGIKSSNKVKVDACLTLRQYMDGEEFNVLLTDDRVVTELEYFEKKVLGNGDFTYRATSGQHDDFVLSLVWAMYILKQNVLDYFYEADYVPIGSLMVPRHLRQFETPSDNYRTDRDLDDIFENIYAKEGTDGWDDEELPDNIGFMNF